MIHADYSVIYEKAKNGGFYAHIFPLDITTEGESLEEAQEMARDAIENNLACRKGLDQRGHCAKDVTCPPTKEN